MRRVTALAAVVLALVLCASALADIPTWMSYQGVLRDGAGNPVPDASYTVEFKLFDVETGGTELWAEVQTLAAEGGIINARLGTVVDLTTLPFDVPYYLSIAVEGEPELLPRTPFATVPYAGHAGFADTCTEPDDDWQISGDDIWHDAGRVGIGSPAVDARLDVFTGDEIAGDFANGSVPSPTVRAANVGGVAGAFFSCSDPGPMPPIGAAVYGRGACGTRGGHFYSSVAEALYAETSGDNTALMAQSYGTGYAAEFLGLPGIRVEGLADLGGIKMAGGAASGYVLTSDVEGYATWQPTVIGSDSDWTVTGSNMYSTPAGYVGIGTAAPTGKLDVQEPGTSAPVLTAGHGGSPARAVIIDRSTTASPGNDILQIGTAFGSDDGCQLIEAERGGSPVFQVFGDGRIVGASGAYISESVEINEGQLLVEFYGNDVGRFISSYPANGAHVIHAECPDTGATEDGIGVYGLYEQATDYGIGGKFEGGYMGVWGVADNSGGIMEHIGVRAAASGSSQYNYGIYASASGGTALAGFFSGDVEVSGTLTASSKSFKIDHPLDPANKYLNHACVESDEMTNVYSGNVTLDGSGKATIELPDWFEAVNTDFRYQLTAIGAPGPNLYVADKIRGNSFSIGGGDPGMEVSWMVTGVRKDPYSVANRMTVEQDKPEFEVGKYIHPDLYGMPETSSVRYRVERGVAEESEPVSTRPAGALDPNDGE